MCHSSKNQGYKAECVGGWVRIMVNQKLCFKYLLKLYFSSSLFFLLFCSTHEVTHSSSSSSVITPNCQEPEINPALVGSNCLHMHCLFYFIFFGAKTKMKLFQVLAVVRNHPQPLRITT